MISKGTKFIAALAIFFSLQFTSAQAQQSKFPHYRIIDLGTNGGSAGIANTINDLGIASGTANVTGDTASHATAWFYGLKQDLGTLGGPNSTVAWPNRNDHGVIAGISELAGTDTMNESFSCPAFFQVDGHSCIAFVWQWGNMTQLPLLGGNNSIGAGINNRDQVVGWAETKVHDSTCVFPQILQFEAVVWGPAAGQVQQLPPYGKDPDSAATAINDEGQVVGISGKCDVAIGAYSAIHAVLWDHGKPHDLGNLGGKGWNTPTVINNLRQVGGFADVPRCGWRHSHSQLSGLPVDQGTRHDQSPHPPGRCHQRGHWHEQRHANRGHLVRCRLCQSAGLLLAERKDRRP